MKESLERASSHVCEGHDLDRPPLEVSPETVRPHDVMEGIVQGAQVGVHLLGDVAGQEPQVLPGLHEGARENDAGEAAIAQAGHREGHREVCLAGPGRPHGEDEFALVQRLHVPRLARGTRAHRLAAMGDDHRLREERLHVLGGVRAVVPSRRTAHRRW